MTQEKPISYLDFKELGSLQQKIIFHLAESPNLNAQAIQKALDYPPSQYPNILKALKTLEKLDVVSSTTAKSKRNVPIRQYRCTLDGVIYALAKNPSADALNTLNAYQNLDKTINSFRKLYDIYGQEIFAKFVRYAYESLRMIHKDGLENAMPYMLMRVATQMRNVDQNTRNRIAKETLKEFPDSRKALKEWRDAINKVL